MTSWTDTQSSHYPVASQHDCTVIWATSESLGAARYVTGRQWAVQSRRARGVDLHDAQKTRVLPFWNDPCIAGGNEGFAAVTVSWSSKNILPLFLALHLTLSLPLPRSPSP